MRKIALLFILCAFLVLSGHGIAYAFPKGGDQDCSKCHTLNNEQAVKILGELIPNIKIINIQPGPMSGVWEIGIDSGGKKGIVYLDYSYKYVFTGSLLSIKEKKNLTQESFSALNKVDVSQIPLTDALVLGDGKAKLRAIVFTDPD